MVAPPILQRSLWNEYQLLRFMLCSVVCSLFHRGRCKPWKSNHDIVEYNPLLNKLKLYSLSPEAFLTLGVRAPPPPADRLFCVGVRGLESDISGCKWIEHKKLKLRYSRLGFYDLLSINDDVFRVHFFFHVTLNFDFVIYGRLEVVCVDIQLRGQCYQNSSAHGEVLCELFWGTKSHR